MKRATILSARGVKSDICPLCSGPHNLRQCPDFAAQRPLQWQETVSGLHLRFNCLGKGHTLTNCPSQYQCRECSSRHHTFLHRSRTTAPDTPSETTPAPQTHTSARASKSLTLTHVFYPPQQLSESKQMAGPREPEPCWTVGLH